MHEVVHFMEVSYIYMYVHVCMLHAWGKGLATQQNCAFVPCINIQIKIGSEEGYVYTHTHTCSMSQLMKWEAEIPLQALFCSDYTVTDRNKEK